VEIRGSHLEVNPGKSMKLYLRNKLKCKRAGGMSQVVEHLPSKCKALGSIPTTIIKKKKHIYVWI
jgi:hypothetical protein